MTEGDIEKMIRDIILSNPRFQRYVGLTCDQMAHELSAAIVAGLGINIACTSKQVDARARESSDWLARRKHIERQILDDLSGFIARESIRSEVLETQPGGNAYPQLITLSAYVPVITLRPTTEHQQSNKEKALEKHRTGRGHPTRNHLPRIIE